jgi:hypothetical protein
MITLFVTGEVVGAKQDLDLLPDLGRDERLVFSLIEDAPVADDAHVVRVTHQPVEVREASMAFLARAGR